jgi:hypothetical protein
MSGVAKAKAWVMAGKAMLTAKSSGAIAAPQPTMAKPR